MDLSHGLILDGHLIGRRLQAGLYRDLPVFYIWLDGDVFIF